MVTTLSIHARRGSRRHVRDTFPLAMRLSISYAPARGLVRSSNTTVGFDYIARSKAALNCYVVIKEKVRRERTATRREVIT